MEIKKLIAHQTMSAVVTVKRSHRMIIMVLGTGCVKCKRLEQEALKAVERSGIDASVEKVEELSKIMEFGIMMTWH